MQTFEVLVEGIPIAQPRPTVQMIPPSYDRFSAAYRGSGNSLTGLYRKLRGLFNGQAFVPSSHKVHPWRRRIEAKVKGVVWDLKIDEPVRVEAVFLFPRTKEQQRRFPTGGRIWYDKKKNDVDNLLKAALDAVNDSKVWSDDGLVVDVAARRYYAGANETPGLRLRISPAGDPNESSGNEHPAQPSGRRVSRRRRRLAGERNPARRSDVE